MSQQSRGFAFSSTLLAVVPAILLLIVTGCNSKPKSVEPAASAPNQQTPATPDPAAAPATPVPTPAVLESTDAAAAQQSTILALPSNFGRCTGDWDQISKRGFLRVLVVYTKSGFFYDRGRPRGLISDAMTEFENVTNNKLKTGVRKFKVVYIPLPPGQLRKALDEGLGDIICSGVIITPEREKAFDFTVPIIERGQTAGRDLEDGPCGKQHRRPQRKRYLRKFGERRQGSA